MFVCLRARVQRCYYVHLFLWCCVRVFVCSRANLFVCPLWKCSGIPVVICLCVHVLVCSSIRVFPCHCVRVFARSWVCVFVYSCAWRWRVHIFVCMSWSTEGSCIWPMIVQTCQVPIIITQFTYKKRCKIITSSPKVLLSLERVLIDHLNAILLGVHAW